MGKRVNNMVDQSKLSGLQSRSAKIHLDRKFVLAQLRTHLDTLRAFQIISLELFGSVARNEATVNSDLDFLVEFKGPATFDRYMDLKFFLEDLFGRPVDLVTKRSLKSKIAQSVLEEAIRVA